MSGVIPKPQMRRLQLAQTKRELTQMVLLALSGAVAFKIFFVNRRAQIVEDFYKTYDCEAALKRMNDAGLMQSCPKD